MKVSDLRVDDEDDDDEDVKMNEIAPPNDDLRTQRTLKGQRSRWPGPRWAIVVLCLLAVGRVPSTKGDIHFLPLIHEPRVYQGAPAGQHVMTVQAYDDGGAAAVITYSLLDGKDMFHVENDTGRVSTRRPVDKVAGENYSMMVVAVSPPNTQLLPATVRVTKVNRHAPRFRAPSYRAEVPFVAPVNATLLTVAASDADADDYNAEVYYILTRQFADFGGVRGRRKGSKVTAAANDDAATYLSVDMKTGELKLKRRLPRRHGVLTARIAATDGGSPKRMNQTDVEVYVRTITAPRDLAVGNATDTTARACWRRPLEGAVVGYLVRYRSIGPEGEESSREHALNRTLDDHQGDENEHCAFLAGLEPTTFYQITVHGWNSEEIGIGSEVVGFNTSVARCAVENVCGNGTCRLMQSLVGTGVSDHVCECHVGFYGPSCQYYNPCSSGPCLNLGECRNTSHDEYECTCRPGLYGKNCDGFDPCANHEVVRCRNGATCVSTLSHQYECLCPLGYYGAYCERFDRCSVTPAPCLNGATCRNATDGSHTCICRPGYRGRRCEIDIDECQSSPCRNGGTCREGIASFQCLCPYAYQGSTCQQPVKCPTATETFSSAALEFGPTIHGTNVTLPCPYGPSGANLTRSCVVEVNGKVAWSKTDLSQCREQGFQMAERLTDHLRNMTSDPWMLDADQVKNVTGQIESVLEYAILDREIAQEIMEVISNLLDANDTAFVSNENVSSASRLAHVLARYVREVVVDREHKIVTANLMVHVLIVNVTDHFDTSLELNATTPTTGAIAPTPDGLTFFGIASKLLSGVNSISPHLLMLDGGHRTGTSERVQTTPRLTVSREVLRLASSRNDRRQQARVHFVGHSNAKLYREQGNVKVPGRATALDRHTPSSRPVFVVNVDNTTVANVSHGVNYTFRKPLYGKWICVYWEQPDSGPGHWSRRGLDVYDDNDTVTCTSDHMTAFSILLDPEPNADLDPVHLEALTIISYVGSGLSVLGLVLTIVTYSMFRSLNRDRPGKILLNLCVSLLLLNVSFITGSFRSGKLDGEIESDATQHGRDVLCTVVAILTHYFVLTTLAWMGVEAANMYQLLIQVFATTESHFLLKRLFIAWGAPMIIVGVTVAVDATLYNPDNEYCMLSPENPYVYYFSFFGPSCLLLLANTVVFVMVTRILFKPRPAVKPSLKVDAKSVTFAQVRGAFTVMTLLGITWVFGALAIGPVRTLFQYVFCVLNSLQGFLLFVVRCLQYPEARLAWLQFFRTGTLKQHRGTKTTTSSHSHGKHSISSTGGGGGGNSMYSQSTRSTFDGQGNGVHPITGTVFKNGVPTVTSSGAISWGKTGTTEISPTWVYGGGGSNRSRRSSSSTTAERRKREIAGNDSYDTKEGRDTCWQYLQLNNEANVRDRNLWVPETSPMRLSAVGAHDLPFIEDDAEKETRWDKEEEETDIQADTKQVEIKEEPTKNESNCDTDSASSEHSPNSEQDCPVPLEDPNAAIVAPPCSQSESLKSDTSLISSSDRKKEATE